MHRGHTYFCPIDRAKEQSGKNHHFFRGEWDEQNHDHNAALTRLVFLKMLA